MSLSTGMSIVSPKSSFRRVHVRALTASGSLKLRLKGTRRAFKGARGRTHTGTHPPHPAPAVPHPAREGGLHVLLELGVLASQVGEVGRLVLVAVAGVHGFVEGHVGPGCARVPAAPGAAGARRGLTAASPRAGQAHSRRAPRPRGPYQGAAGRGGGQLGTAPLRPSPAAAAREVQLLRPISDHYGPIEPWNVMG